MHTDMYKTYDDVSIAYSYPYSFDGENRPYLVKKEKVDYTINDGSIANTLQISLSDLSSTVSVNIKSYRYDVVYKTEGINPSSTITVTIPANTLGAGIYHIEVINDTSGSTVVKKDLIVLK